MANYYVDPNAPSGGTGTFERPWKNISQANAKQFSTSDCVYFRAGTTIHVDARMVVNWNGAPGSPLVIGTYSDKYQFGSGGLPRPVLVGRKDENDPMPSGGYQAIIDHAGPGYITVQDLHIKNSGRIGIQLGEVFYSDRRTATECYVKNCISQDSGRQGIILARATHSVIEDCVIDGASQVPILEASGKVAYNGAGIEVNGGGGIELAVYNTVRRCIIRRAGESLGAYLGARHTTIEDNIIFDPGRVGIYAANARDGVIRNNIVYWNNDVDSNNHIYTKDKTRKGLIHIDAEGHIANTIKVTGGWEISGNYLAGGSSGIWIQSNSNSFGAYQKDNRVFDNVIVDCDNSFWIHQAVTGWENNEIFDNYSFVYTPGCNHVKLPVSPIGVTWYNNHYNTTVAAAPTGNAANQAVINGVKLLKQTGWRDLPVGLPPITADWFAMSPIPPSQIAAAQNLRVVT